MNQPMGIVRALRLLLIWFIAGNMWDAAALTLWADSSDSYRVAVLSGYQHAVGWLFVAAMVLLVPLAAVNISLYADASSRTAARMAALGAMLGALLWIGLAYIAKDGTGLQTIRIIYLRSGLEAMAFAILVSAAVNDDLKQLRKITPEDFGESNRVDLGKQ